MKFDLKMRIFPSLLCGLALTFGLARSGVAATLNVPCDFLSISNACMTAKEGDVVWIQPGSCVISNTIVINRNTSFTIHGSGTNSTTLIAGSPSTSFFVTSDSHNVFTISDLNCVGAVGQNYGFFSVGGNPPATPMNGPVHFYNIQMTNVYNRGIAFGYGDSFGLVDHCYFKTQYGRGPQPISFGGNMNISWTNSNPLGSTNACYVEDCTFDNGTNAGNGFFDAYNGAQLVWRHNYCSGNAPSGVHGYDSQYTSTRTWEIYNNIFTNVTGTVNCMELRGGTGVVFSNQVYGAADVCELAYYRSCNNYPVTQNLGIPGYNFVVCFSNGAPTVSVSGTNVIIGVPITLTNGQKINLGCSTYTFNTTYQNTIHSALLGGGSVVIGPTLAASISNLAAAINCSAGAGTVYAASMTPNYSFSAFSSDGTNLFCFNKLDGNTDPYGYPANQQPGVIQANIRTNIQTLLPAYAWGNTLNGASHDFTLKDPCGNNQNVVMLNRDYFNGTPMPGYTPLVYPHPLQAMEIGGQNSASAPPLIKYIGPGH